MTVRCSPSSSSHEVARKVPGTNGTTSRTAHVWPEPARRVGDEVEVAAVVEWPPFWPRFWKDRRQRVFVRVPGEVEIPESAVADAFLLGTVFGAMRRARSLHLHAAVTSDLVENLERLQALWVERRPDKYHLAPIRTDGAAPAVPPTGPAILCFSGGIDSAFALFSATRPDRFRDDMPVGRALMILGADIPIGEEAAFSRALERSRRMCESRGVPLAVARTNLRIVKQNWTHSSTATLAGVMNLFRAHHGAGLVAIGFTRDEARQWWPQDETDPPLVASSAFPVLSHGWEADRFEKFDAMRDWPEALENLRVCYRPGIWDRNCGTCFKCLTVMFFARVSRDRMPSLMPRDVTVADVAAMATCLDSNIYLRMQQIWRHGRARGVTEPWLAAIEDVLRAAGRIAPGPVA